MGTLQFIGWLKHHLDRRTFDGCVWIDKENQIFKISWPRADKNLTPEKLGVMFKWWTHKFGSTRNHNQPTAIKGNFRSCLNSKVQSSDIRKMKNMDTREDADDWKVFQFVDSFKDSSKATGGYNKRRLRPNPDPVESVVTENDDGSTPYEPESEYYAEDTIRAEFDEVMLTHKQWIVNITAYSKGKVKLWDYQYNFMEEFKGVTKLHVFVKGESRRTHFFPEFFKAVLPNYESMRINNLHPIDPMKSEFLRKEFSNAADSGSTARMTMKDTFCPGFIFEVDKNLNVFITRLSQSHFYFGHHGKTNEWQKLGSLRTPTGYSEAEEHKDGVKQMVFSYKKFVHNAKVYENWLDNGPDKPHIDLIDWRVLLPVDKPPRMGHGCDTDCEFYFEIEHLPARVLYDRIKEKEDGRGASLKVSEEPPFVHMMRAMDKMNVKESNGQQQQQQQMNPVPPPAYDTHVHSNPTNLQYDNPFGPGPNVWASPAGASGYTAANTGQNIDLLFKESMLRDGFHAGHMPNSPISNSQLQFNQVPYDVQYNMQEIPPTMNTCDGNWSDSPMSPGSDTTLTNMNSPYMADASYDNDQLMFNTCLQPQNCTCLTCISRGL